MIQMLTYNEKEGKEKFQGKDIVVNSFHQPDSLDSFDIDIINLQSEDIWCNRGNNKQSINSINDFVSMEQMIKNSQNTSIIILFPQNYIFKYNSYRGGYTGQCELKDMLDYMLAEILARLFFPLRGVNLIYENNKTDIGNIMSPSAFCIQGFPDENILTVSDKSNKVTTAYLGKVILSMIMLGDYDSVLGFLRKINLYQDRENCPEWMQEIKMLNDIYLEQEIQEEEQKILQHKQVIEEKKFALQRNKRYESILYTTGDELVKVVYEILEKMLGCDLSNFEDKHKEDFYFEMGDIIFIGEIKGISSNVQYKNVAQLDMHVQKYRDEHEGEEKEIIALLIINHQRTKPLEERNRVHNDQIKLAKRNGSLIVETISLLRLFEQYLNGSLNASQCVEILKRSIGILEKYEIV